LKISIIVWPDFAFMFVYCYAGTHTFMSSGSVHVVMQCLCRHAVWRRSELETHPTSSHRQMSRTDDSTRQP